MKDNIKWIIMGVIILISVVGYLFIVKPAISREIINAYNQGIQYALISIMQEAFECRDIPLTNSNNITITLFAKECLNVTKES